jgi:hypothetical protein
MQKVYLIIVLLFTSLSVKAQTAKITEIDNLADKIDSNISSDADFHDMYMVHEIKFETNKRAIGKQYTSVKFYYPMPGDSVVESDAGTDFLYIYKQPVLVSVQYNIAASQNNTFNYYFDDSGELMLYQYLSAGAYGSESSDFYFNKGELLMFQTHTPDNNTIRVKDFTRHDLFVAGNISKRAKEYKKMFDDLVKLEDIDK